MRSLLSASGLAGVAQPMVEFFATAQAAPAGFSPAQIRHAYGFDAVSGNGAGQTIAIVDAYDDPTIASDLHTFDAKFGLPDPWFAKAEMLDSKGNAPKPNLDWAGEIALDVEWAHAIAPAANILLVEANSALSTDLLAAVDYARNCFGVSVVSMSWGGRESSSDATCNSYFTTPAWHAGVTFVASTGDDGAGVSYPAASPNVLAVGGTSLTLKAGNYGSESAWTGSGGGASHYEPEPSWQRSVQSYGTRTNPDISFDANPSTGVAVYGAYGLNGWGVLGGTSISAPQVAGMIAIINQARATPLRNATSDIYSLAKSSPGDFHDITSGSNGYRATTGYDLATGLGTPVANKLIADLIKSADATPVATKSGTGTPVGGSASWGRWSVALLPPGGLSPQAASAFASWQTASLDVAVNGTAASSYVASPMSVDLVASWQDADTGSSARTAFPANLLRTGDFGMVSSGSVSALLGKLLDRDASDAAHASSLADGTTVAGLPAHGILGDASAPASALWDRLPAIPISDLPTAAVDGCFDEDSFGEQYGDALVRVDAAETTGTSRAAALAMIPLIFSRFEEEPSIGHAESRRRWHFTARERR